MNKRNAEHSLTQAHSLQPWHLLVAATVFGVVAVYSLRSNYSHMVDLRDKVYAADQAGKGVNEALENLRNYTGQHMNTKLSSGANAVYPPIQLKYTYDRLIQAKSKQTSDYNSLTYNRAQKYCEARIKSFHGINRIQCIQNYVKSHNASPTYISADLYKFDFYSPVWSADIAGFSLVFAGLSAASALVLFAIRRWLK